jgi:hypothetical protein
VQDGKYTKLPKTREDNWVWSPQGFVDMHRPEYWGHVQFSTAPPGDVSVIPDPADPVRDRLIQIYHAQWAFHEKNNRWAGRIEDLELPPTAPGFAAHTADIRLTEDGFEAAITFKPDGAANQTWSIRQDSRLARKH